MSDNDELRGALVDLFERHGFHWSETEIKAVLDASAALGDAWSWKMAADEAEKEVKALRAALDEAEARAVKAEAERDAANALLREARTDLEHYVTTEYPKDKHPYYKRQWNRDMELCRRIDAHLGAKP